jgi:hypothetical protein
MHLLYLAAGIALLVGGGFMLIIGLPRHGEVKAFATSELYTFPILITLAAGVAFVLNAALG